jgi:hypothetical protein
LRWLDCPRNLLYQSDETTLDEEIVNEFKDLVE